MIFGSVCSGIEAASCAWHPLGWRAAWLSEIEPFPSAVLAHHYPTVPNLGDMTKIARAVLVGDVAAPDVLVGGTPCQAFSVAGLREGLDDERGQLTLSYVRLFDAIDYVRGRSGRAPAVCVWENVPGVLSDKTNAFGCLLAGLAGEDVQLEPPGKKWANAGCVFGPARTVAWRVLDAQHFGLAQRRRRVFVVASARKDFNPCDVLFEFDGVRRDSAPSREAGQETAGTLASRTGAGGFPGTDEACSGYLQAFGGGNTSGAIDVASCLTTSGQRLDFDTETFAIQAGALRTNPNSGPDGVGVQAGIAYTMEARAEVQAVAAAFDMQQITSPHNRASVDSAAPAPTMAKGSSMHAIQAFQSSQSGVRLGDTHATLDANNGPRRHNGALVGMAVRRLTPVECERLQGFPDGWTDVPYRGKSAADGPRYKALGNSMAVPCMAFIGSRIDAAVRAGRKAA